MFARIASVALTLTLAVLTACAPEPEEPARTPPATGAAGQQADRSAAGDRTGTQQSQPPGTTTSGQPAQGGQHYDSGAARTGMHDQSEGMSEAERQAALRACEQLQAAERERCQAEVRERTSEGTDPEPMPRDGQE